jgi:hypothetical protein
MKIKKFNCRRPPIRLFVAFALSMIAFSADAQNDLAKDIKDAKEAKQASHARELELRKQIATLQKAITSGKFIDTTQMVIYDFRSKRYLKSNVRPRVGEPIVFRIININRLAYEVSIKSQDIAIADENFDPDLNIVIRNENLAGKITDIPEKVPTPSTLTRDAVKPDKSQQGLSKKDSVDLNKEILNLRVKRNQMKIDIENNALEIKMLEGNANYATDEALKTQFEEAKRDEIKFQKDIAELDEQINYKERQVDIQKATANAINKNLNDLNVRYAKLLDLINSLRQMSDEYDLYRNEALNPLLTHENYKNLNEETLRVLTNSDQYKQKIMQFQSELAGFYANYNLTVNDWENLNELENFAKENVLLKCKILKDEVDKIGKIFINFDLKNKLIRAKGMDKVLSNVDSYTIASSPIQPFEDYIVFDVEIKHKESLTEYDDDRKFKYMEYTKGGVRFDFSTGVVFDFSLDKNDRDHDDHFDEYQIVDVVDPQGQPKKQIQGVARNEFIPSLAGMFHMSFRRTGNVSLGLTLGASLNVETFELNSLFPGASVMIGKKQKFVLTIGPSFRQRDILKKNYSLKAYYDPDEFGSGTEITKKQFKIGLFFGITYNLTQKQRGKFKINGSQSDGTDSE